MLFAGSEVRIVKTVAGVLKMLPEAARTDPKPVNNLFIFSSLSNDFVFTPHTLTQVLL